MIFSFAGRVVAAVAAVAAAAAVAVVVDVSIQTGFCFGPITTPAAVADR